MMAMRLRLLDLLRRILRARRFLLRRRRCVRQLSRLWVTLQTLTLLSPTTSPFTSLISVVRLLEFLSLSCWARRSTLVSRSSWPLRILLLRMFLIAWDSRTILLILLFVRMDSRLLFMTLSVRRNILRTFMVLWRTRSRRRLPFVSR